MASAQWYSPRFDESSLRPAATRYDGNLEPGVPLYRTNPEPRNEAIPEIDNIAAPSRPDLDPHRAIQNQPPGMRAISDGDYQAVIGGPRGELELRVAAKDELFKTSPKARFARMYAGYARRRFNQMFERPSPLPIPAGYAMPRAQTTRGGGTGPSVPIQHFANNDPTSFVNVDYNGRLATLANLEDPRYWTDDELIFAPEVLSSMEQAVSEIKQHRPALKSAPSDLEKWYNDEEADHDFVVLFARYAGNIDQETQRLNGIRQTYQVDEERIPERRLYNPRRGLPMQTPLIDQMLPFKWDETQKRIVRRK